VVPKIKQLRIGYMKGTTKVCIRTAGDISDACMVFHQEGRSNGFVMPRKSSSSK